MIPTEKASELINKYRDENYFSEKEIIENAKLNAIICVDEILGVVFSQDFYIDVVGKKIAPYQTHDFWTEVKKEIHSL